MLDVPMFQKPNPGCRLEGHEGHVCCSQLLLLHHHLYKTDQHSSFVSIHFFSSLPQLQHVSGCARRPPLCWTLPGLLEVVCAWRWDTGMCVTSFSCSPLTHPSSGHKHENFKWIIQHHFYCHSCFRGHSARSQWLSCCCLRLISRSAKSAWPPPQAFVGLMFGH